MWIFLVITLTVLWSVGGISMLNMSGVYFPTTIKQFIFQSIITGPFGSVLMICHYIMNHDWYRYFRKLLNLIGYINDKLK